MSTVYLNGQYLPLDKATVSVTDRGFLFADGVYEVIPVYSGHILRAEPHLQRLDHSLAALSIEQPLKRQQWLDIFQQLIADNQLTDCIIYLQITRGAQEIRQHGFAGEDLTPTVYVRCSPFHLASIEELAQGFSAITLEDTRHKNCHIKSIALLSNVLLYNEAQLDGAYEAILIDQGNAIEGSSSNLFIVKNDVIITPPKHSHILGGITRELILELAQQDGIATEERFIKDAELQSADEIWLTSSGREIRPITELNHAPVAGGEPGPLWWRMIELYKGFIQGLPE